MGLWDRIRARMDDLGIKTQKELEAAVTAAGGSLPQSQISGIKNGLVHRPRAILELAAALKTTPEWLTEKDNSQDAPIPQYSFRDGETSPTSREGRIVTAITPLVEWLSVDGPDRAGEILVYKQRINVQTRPEELTDSPDAFAVRMRFSDMSPAIEAGNILLVQPEAPIIYGKDYLFVLNRGVGSPFTGLPRRLVRETADHWIVRSFHPETKDVRLPIAQWTPWFIYGKYNR